MKIKLSIVYLIVYVFGVIAAGILTGIYGDSIGIWVSYCFLGAYGIMILLNATMIEKSSNIDVGFYEKSNELTPEQAKELPESLGEGNKVGVGTLEERDVPPEPPEIKEEGKKLTEAEINVVKKIADYIKENLEKGHSLEKIRQPLDKVYGAKAVDWVLQNAIKIEEPELPDLGEPEEIVTPETLNKEIKKPKKKSKKPKKDRKKEVEIVDPEHFK